MNNHPILLWIRRGERNQTAKHQWWVSFTAAWEYIWTRQDLFGFPSFNFHDSPWAKQDKATSNLGGKKADLIAPFSLSYFVWKFSPFSFPSFVISGHRKMRASLKMAAQTPQTLAAVLVACGVNAFWPDRGNLSLFPSFSCRPSSRCFSSSGLHSAVWLVFPVSGDYLRDSFLLLFFSRKW